MTSDYEYDIDPRDQPSDQLPGFYSVPLVTEGLTHRETVTQICDIMRHLQRVSDDVVQRITARTAANAARLQAMNDRIAKLDSTVTALQQSTKPIQLVCPGVYPIDQKHDMATVPRLFTTGRPPTIKWTKIPFNELVQSYRNSETPIDTPQIHVRTNRLLLHQLPTASGDQQSSNSCRRLIPPALRSASALLVNNSSERAYGDIRVDSDDEDVVAMTTDQLTKSHALDPDDSSLAEAADSLGDTPHSLLMAEDSDLEEQDSFWYKPQLGDVPDLAAPLSLPGLSSAALDLSLPEPLSFLSDRFAQRTVPRVDKSAPTGAGVKAGSSASSSITTPSSDTHSSSTGDQTRRPGGEKTVTTAVPIPAPPPLPPPAPSIPEPTTSKQDNVPIQTDTANTGDFRSALMDAIRRAGGAQNAKLKTNTNQNQPSVPEKKPGDASPGDLMSDLTAKLALRRKGISGNNARVQVDASDLLSRMSSLIPPPPADSPQSTAINSDDDQDWD